MHHVHLWLPAPLEAQAWYIERTFGATAGKRGDFDTANVPGVELTFTRQEPALAPTLGRSLDHIGFEVRDLEAFLKRLPSLGIARIDGPRLGGNKTTKISYVKDPWGTRIGDHRGPRRETLERLLNRCSAVLGAWFLVLGPSVVQAGR